MTQKPFPLYTPRPRADLSTVIYKQTIISPSLSAVKWIDSVLVRVRLVVIEGSSQLDRGLSATQGQVVAGGLAMPRPQGPENFVRVLNLHPAEFAHFFRSGWRPGATSTSEPNYDSKRPQEVCARQFMNVRTD